MRTRKIWSEYFTRRSGGLKPNRLVKLNKIKEKIFMKNKARKILSAVLILSLVLATACNKAEHSYGELLPFSNSAGRDVNGYWEGLTALDYVDIFTYTELEIPKEEYEVSDEAIDDAITGFLTQGGFPPMSEKITDKSVKVKEGDLVNIDFVGSVDGEEFPGGNTRESGPADVTAGSEDFIDDFLTQIIGHSPGDTVDVNVTFPEDYGEEGTDRAELNGQPALFVVDINYIHGDETDLTDEYVMENLNEENEEWKTVEDVRNTAREALQDQNVYAYIEKYLIEQVEIDRIPDYLIKRIEKSQLEQMNEQAEEKEMTLTEFIEEDLGIEGGIEAWAEKEREKNIEDARFHLALQAIAEDMNLIIDDAGVTAFFEQRGIADPEQQEEQLEQHGKPFIKQLAMRDTIIDHMIDNAVLLD
jgi:trigger factor